MKRLHIILLFFLVPLVLSAQRKQLLQAQEMIKTGTTLDKAESLMASLLRESKHRNNPKLWLTLYQAQRAQYEQANEKLYLKQKNDTSAFFRLTRKLFLTAESLDSVEQKRLSKPNAQPHSRQDNARYLSQIRSNLYYGGTFFTTRGKLSEALDMFDTYIDCHRQPLFSKQFKADSDTLLAAAAYWAMTASLQQADNDKALSYLPLARRDTTYLEQTLINAAQAYLNKNDTTQYVDILKEGFSAFPLSPYFFTRLVDHYEHTANDSLAMQLVDQALAADSLSSLFLLAKSSVLLNMGNYDECIAICKKLLATDEQQPDAHYNMGIALFNKAITMEKELMRKHVKSSQRRRAKREIAELFEASRPHIESYRRSFPANVLMWSGPLYTIYLNLNMGNEFEEIEKIRDEYRKNNKQSGPSGAQ